MSLDSIKKPVENDLIEVNQTIINNISKQVGLIDDLAHHIVESGGKRLRPILVLLSAHAFGYEGKKHILHACAVEFFHAATLLHDDVLDESTLRRGVETANNIWGSKASILVGDYLLTQSIQLMVEAGDLENLAILTKCAHEITCGEVKQLTNARNVNLTEAEYYDVIRSKTSLLFQASSEMGAHLGKQSPETIEHMRQYGLHLGNAFQIIDDTLDYEAKSHTIGKNPGDDLHDGKVTLPLIFAFEKATSEETNLIQDSIKKGKRENLNDILTILTRTNALNKTYLAAEQEIDKALTALNDIPESIYKEALINLAQFSIKRKF
jgi:octaprenyl-diphosphate synthase